MTNAALTEADLGMLGPQLGRGGQASVHDAPALGLPDVAGHLVYKRYHAGKARRPHDMARLIAVRDNLNPVDRGRLDAIAAWPLRVVVDGGDLLGVVLPRIPDSFFQSVILPSGGPTRCPREVQHLFVAEDRCRRIGMLVATAEQRLEICRDFAAALDLLHGPTLDVVFGDINAKNVLFRLGESPTVMLVDCDAVRRRGDVTGEPQLNAPDWQPPARTSLNRTTDRYKLGLFVLRCLAEPGEQTSTRIHPAGADGALDEAGRELLRAALDDAPELRPSAREWLHYLSSRLGQPLDPPTLDDAVPDRTLIALGEPVTVLWSAIDAVTIEVEAPGGAAVTCDGRAGCGAIDVYPVQTGPLTVTARNARGAIAVRTEPVYIFDLPDPARLQVVPPVRPLDAVRLPLPPDVWPALVIRGTRPARSSLPTVRINRAAVNQSA